MRMDKRRYKLAIKSTEKVAADQFSNSLNDALVNKDMDACGIRGSQNLVNNNEQRL